MRNPFRARLRIGLSRTGISLLRTGTAFRTPDTLLADTVGLEADAATADQLMARLRHLLSESGQHGVSTAIIVSDDWVRYFIVTPPADATSLDDCKAAAAMRFQSLYGDAPAAWRIEADWQASTPFLACAMPGALTSSLADIAADFRLHLTRITPQFIAAWNRSARQASAGAWFGTLNANLMTLAAIENRGLHSVRSMTLPAGVTASAEWLEKHLEREALRLGLATPSRICLCGQVPPAWIGEKSEGISRELAGPAIAPEMTSGVALARTGMRA